MRVLILGAMHGNEPLGPAVVKLFQQNPVKGVAVAIANPRARKAGKRYIEQDLNRSFPGESCSEQYEVRRAAEILQLCQGYDVVLDFHNTTCPNNDCAFVGETAVSKLYDIASWLGLDRVVVADYDCINKYVPTCVSIEVSLTSDMCDAARWYEKISELASVGAVRRTINVTRYKFVYRMTLEDKARFGLDMYNLQAFQLMPTQLAAYLRIPSPAYPIFIADTYTPYNYGGVLRKIDVY